MGRLSLLQVFAALGLGEQGPGDLESVEKCFEVAFVELAVATSADDVLGGGADLAIGIEARDEVASGVRWDAMTAVIAVVVIAQRASPQGG